MLQKPEENKIILPGKWEKEVNTESFKVDSNGTEMGSISNYRETQAKAQRHPKTQCPGSCRDQ